MATAGRLKLKQPLDNWSIRERLALACSVLRSGDQNWVSVARQIKPFGESDRSTEWFSQRNCALQYSDLLETVETPNRMKRGERKSVGSTETPQLQIARKLTLERVDELRELIKQEQDEYYKLRDEVDRIKAGECDDELEEMWEHIQSKERVKKESEAAQQQLSSEQGDRGDGGSTSTSTPSLPSTPVPSSTSAISDSGTPLAAGSSIATPPIKEIKIKIEAEDTSEDTHISVTEDDMAMETDVPHMGVEEEVVQSDSFQATLDESTRENTPASSTVSDYFSTNQDPLDDIKKTGDLIKQEIVEIKEELTEEVVEVEDLLEDSTVTEEVVTETPVSELSLSGKDVHTKVETEGKDSEEVFTEQSNTSHVQESQESVHLDDNQPLSPTSSVASHDTDVTIPFTGTNPNQRRGRSKQRGNSRRGRKSQSARKDPQEEKETKPPSEIDSSDDDEKESNASTKPSMSFVGSLPSSPAGSNQGDLDLAERELKNWRKSIMLVWRAASNHKYAKVFQQPVTDSIAPGYKSIVLRYACVFSHAVTEEIAPGYHDIVYRPMDLQTIKKNIETGQLTTTPEFQRDIMLMFTNAIMYNNCDHNVYHMAQEMYDDVMHNIEQYINTQVMLTSESSAATTKTLRQSRRTDGLSGSERSDIDKEEDPKKTRRISTEAVPTDGGGKAKKRKN